MQSTNDRNSDVDDISINTNLKVFNGGLGLNKNQKKESNNNSINKNEKNKISNYNKEFQDIKEKNYKENNLNARSKEIKLDKDSLIETEGIISFRSKKISKTENDETPNINNITNGIINKIDKLNKNPNKKETRNFINNSINDSNLNEEHTINKIFKLNDEKETEKEIKNFEKESQRIQSKILAGNPLESSSSDFSEEYDKYEGFSTDKIKKTLDDINLKNLNKNGKTKSNLNINAIENKPINNYNKNYNTIGGDEKINFGNSPFDDNNQQNDSGDINEKNIFWNLRGNNEEIENSNFNHNNYYKRSKSAIDRDFNNGIYLIFFKKFKIL